MAIASGDRLQTWMDLLHVPAIVVRTLPSAPTKDDQGNRAWIKTLIQDVMRTRVDTLAADARGVLSDILLRYCLVRRIAYKQGLNELLAPLVILFYDAKKDNRSLIFALFSAVVDRFLPGIYEDNDFRVLSTMFTSFRELMQYHDPKLFRQLESADSAPSHYCSSWFLTWFARQLPVDVVAALWDYLIIHDDPLLHLFVGVAIFIQERESIVNCDISDLPPLLANVATLSISIETIPTLIAKAMTLRDATPWTFSHRLLYQHPDEHSAPDRSCVIFVPPIEIYGQITAAANQLLFKFLLLDCRTEVEFNNGHLPGSILFDQTLLEDGDKLLAQFESMSGMSDCHFCLIGGRHDQGGSVMSVLNRVQLHLLQHNVPHVSVCEGGFAAYHAYIIANAPKQGIALHLVDHKPAACLECSSPLDLAVSKLWSLKSLRLSEVATKFWRASSSPALAAIVVHEDHSQGHHDDDHDPDEFGSPVDLDLARLCDGGDVSVFKASMLMSSASEDSPVEIWESCLVAVAKGYLMILQQQKQQAGKVRLHRKYAWDKLVKIGRWKDDRKVVVFHWARDGASIASSPLRIDKSSACIARVKALCQTCLQARVKQ